MKLVECVPNFSEGRRKDVIEAVVSAAKSKNVKVLDIESDVNHNRSVLTFVGEPDAVKDAALAMSAIAIELIDLNKHTGEHPRMGAVDVVPFIPISDMSMSECVGLAKTFAREYASSFNVPVFLYEAAATRPDRRNLANVRKGEFEGLRKQIGHDPAYKPDFGPEAIHPTAGATAVGARQILIAYNINLATTNSDVAKRIARQVRGRDGGLAAVKALGFELKDRSMVQVSMNMVDYKASQLFKAFELVRSLAQQEGVEVAESEIVGLVPTEALTDTAKFYLRLHEFKNEQILERKLYDASSNKFADTTLAAFSSAVASERPVPGGGSVSAVLGSFAASLVSMVARLTVKKTEMSEHAPAINAILAESESLRSALLVQADADAASFEALIQAYKLPKSAEREKELRVAEIQENMKKACNVPLRTAELTLRALAAGKQLIEYANLNVISDLETAIATARAAIEGSLANVKINLSGVTDADYKRRTHDQIATVEQQAERDEKDAHSALSVRVKTRA